MAGHEVYPGFGQSGLEFLGKTVLTGVHQSNHFYAIFGLIKGDLVDVFIASSHQNPIPWFESIVMNKSVGRLRQHHTGSIIVVEY